MEERLQLLREKHRQIFNKVNEVGASELFKTFLSQAEDDAAAFEHNLNVVLAREKVNEAITEYAGVVGADAKELVLLVTKAGERRGRDDESREYDSGGHKLARIHGSQRHAHVDKSLDDIALACNVEQGEEGAHNANNVEVGNGQPSTTISAGRAEGSSSNNVPVTSSSPTRSAGDNRGSDEGSLERSASDFYVPATPDQQKQGFGNALSPLVTSPEQLPQSTVASPTPPSSDVTSILPACPAMGSSSAAAAANSSSNVVDKFEALHNKFLMELHLRGVRSKATGKSSEPAQMKQFFFGKHGFESVKRLLHVAELEARRAGEVHAFLNGDGSRRSALSGPTKKRLIQLMNFMNSNSI